MTRVGYEAGLSVEYTKAMYTGHYGTRAIRNRVQKQLSICTGYQYVYTTATHHFPGKVPKPNLEAMATKGAIYGGWSGNNR